MVFASLVVGQVLRLGAHRIEVPISALLVLVVGGQPGVARARVLETLIGAGVGVAVNVLVAPPVSVQSAGPRQEPGAWQVYGAVLANTDRLLSEIDPEGQTWPGVGRLS